MELYFYSGTMIRYTKSGLTLNTVTVKPLKNYRSNGKQHFQIRLYWKFAPLYRSFVPVKITDTLLYMLSQVFSNIILLMYFTKFYLQKYVALCCCFSLLIRIKYGEKHLSIGVGNNA